MGNTSYNVSSRTLRASSAGYTTVTMDTLNTVFTQNEERKIHESMDPKKIKVREARDSETHPNTIPIIFALDLTGSMRKIPMNLIKNGLPHLMDNLIQKGAKDATLLFMGIGDTECDRAPLQVGQFESGDLELDTWLTRTFIEGGGGGNEGESYLLAWYFAANHVETDAWDKRKQKGILFTVGDEPSLKTIPKNVLSNLMEESSAQSTLHHTDLLKAAQEKFHVYHLHVMEGAQGKESLKFWKELLGQNCIVVDNNEDIPNIMVDIIINKNQNSKIENKVEEEIL